MTRGLVPNLGVDFHLPLRLVRDRVRYEDLARQPYTPPNPGLHHRNETLFGLADPQVGLDYGRTLGAWAVATRIGLSIPIGRTEANPFELGRLGLWHQHIQFGTGTWDPILAMTVGRPAGPLDLRLSGIARFAGGENEHGYRAGPRYSLGLGGSPYLGGDWNASAGLTLVREEPEKWRGRVEDEGNLGRTDLLMSLGAGRTISSLGALSLNLQFPLTSKTTGEQVKIPVIVSLGWGL